MLALEGFRVLDLTRFLSGPYCTMVLAELGADVVKVEQPGTGDDSRRLNPKVNGESYPYGTPNRSKRSVSLDFTSGTRQAKTTQEIRRHSEDSIPMGGYGEPRELAAVVRFLPSAQATYITASRSSLMGHRPIPSVGTK